MSTNASRSETWVVEDNALLRESIVDALAAATPGGSRGFASCEGAIEALETGLLPEIVLMDIGLPGVDGIEGTRRIHALSPLTRIIMLTIHEDDDKIVEALCAGASGYLLKPSSSSNIVDAVESVRNGGSPINARIASRVLSMFVGLAAPRNKDYGLTRREVEVLELLVEGLIQKQIADRLCVSEHTVNTHVRNIYAKLHVHTRSGAVAKALRERLL